MTYITTAGTYTIGKVYGILVQINKVLSATTLTVADGGTTIAVITNPVEGAQFRYFGFTGSVTCVPSGTVDVTVSALNHQG